MYTVVYGMHTRIVAPSRSMLNTWCVWVPLPVKHNTLVFRVPLLQVQFVNTVPPAQGARTLLAATDLSQLVAPRNWSCTVSALVDGADVTAVSPCRLANASFGAADTPWALSSCPRHHSPRRGPAPAPTTSPASPWSAMTTAGAHVHDHSASIVSTSDVASGVASPHRCNKLHAGSC